VGLGLWGSGADVALQIWLENHYHHGFNNVMRFLGDLALGRTQIIALLVLGLGVALWRGGLVGVGQALKAFGFQTLGWLKGQPQWLPVWQGVPRLTRVALMALPLMALAGALQVFAKMIIGRPRPKAMFFYGHSPFKAHPFSLDVLYWSFPSGHAVSTFALAVWLAYAYPRWRWALMGVATVLACSRFLAVTPHYLGDVVAGAALGAAVALWVTERTLRGRSNI
jgi:membrane-associated phospholipid phosphatase